LDNSGMVFNQNTHPALGEDFASNPNYKANVTNGFGMGAMLMLPRNFDMTQFNSPIGLAQGYALRDYGGYIVDTAGGTFSMNITNDASILFNTGNNATILADGGQDYGLIRDNISQVIRVDGWIDANDVSIPAGTVGYNPFLGPGQSGNWEGSDLLGMRGPWAVAAGKAFGHYDTTLFQGLGGYIDPGGSTPNSLMQTAVFSNQYLPPNSSPPQYGWWTFWKYAGLMVAHPIPGRQYTFKCLGTGALTITINVFDNTNKKRTTFSLGPGQQHLYTWPHDLTNIAGFYIQMFIASGNGSGGTIKVQMI
jgi:hypothetical protein